MPTDPEPLPPPTTDELPPPSTAGIGPAGAFVAYPATVSTLHKDPGAFIADSDPSADPRPGQRLGDFFLVEELGAGSFARVFLAVQVSLGRQVALKVARTNDSEAQTLAGLEHEHIVPVYSESIDPQPPPASAVHEVRPRHDT